MIEWILSAVLVASLGCSLNVEPVRGELVGGEDAAPSVDAEGVECIIGGYDVCGLSPGSDLTFASVTIFDTDSNGPRVQGVVRFG